MALSSCKKDQPVVTPPPIPVTSSTDYLKLTVGNYWIYEKWEIDTLGKETFMETDSMWISGQTNIRGHVFYSFKSSGSFCFCMDSMVADSTKCGINTAGKIFFSENNFDTMFQDTVWTSNKTFDFHFEKSNPSPTSVTVPAGTFKCIEFALTNFINDPTYYPSLRTRACRRYYSDQIGLVKQTYYFRQTPMVYERRLVRYKVV